MSITNSAKAQILVDALPYIQKYAGNIVVIKYGGNAMTDSKLKNAVMSDIVLLSQVGIRVVLVHGGGPEINEMFGRLGKESRFIHGLRHTDGEAIDIVQMVLAGRVNKELVMSIQKQDGRAIGLCGIDGYIIKAEQKDKDLGYVGKITSINIVPVLDILEKGYIPVIATTAAGEDGNIYNINADEAASRLASELGAMNFILMTDVKGLLRDPNDKFSLISKINIAEIHELIKSDTISGGMIPKLKCCIDAVSSGVGQTTIIDGRVLHAVLIEMLSNEGIGTLICK
ncbi:MAG: acetylglutamate kinase [Oscillospiraceae bacterium]|nr:acetylglutamate kinase [Oscillospiraceae bacterium]